MPGSTLGRAMAFAIAAFTSLSPPASRAMGVHFIPSRHGDYCRDEIYDYVARRFGPRAKVGQIIKSDQEKRWSIWAKMSFCSGFLVFEYFPGDYWSTCQQGRYGSVNPRLMEVWGDGDCLRYVRMDVNPRG